MSAITGTWQDGRIVLSEAVDWPEGTKVMIAPLGQQPALGIRDEDWPTDPQGIARLVALMENFEPVALTSDEQAEWDAARRAQRQHDRACADDRAQRTEEMFE